MFDCLWPSPPQFLFSKLNLSNNHDYLNFALHFYLCFFIFLLFILGVRKLEVPIVWEDVHDIIQYKKDSRVDEEEDHDHVDTSCALESTGVSENFLLMKFYSLSSGVVKHLLTVNDGTEIDIPFELSDEEEAIIRFPLTSFILGRSGTGKTTVLTMKLIQIEQQSLIASQGPALGEVDSFEVDNQNVVQSKDAGKQESFVKQVFITVSPKLCSAIKNQILRLKR